jgi:hypothetical protein
MPVRTRSWTIDETGLPMPTRYGELPIRRGDTLFLWFASGVRSAISHVEAWCRRHGCVLASRVQLLLAAKEAEAAGTAKVIGARSRVGSGAVCNGSSPLCCTLRDLNRKSARVARAGRWALR